MHVSIRISSGKRGVGPSGSRRREQPLHQIGRRARRWRMRGGNRAVDRRRADSRLVGARQRRPNWVNGSRIGATSDIRRLQRSSVADAPESPSGGSTAGFFEQGIGHWRSSHLRSGTPREPGFALAASAPGINGAHQLLHDRDVSPPSPRARTRSASISLRLRPAAGPVDTSGRRMPAQQSAPRNVGARAAAGGSGTRWTRLGPAPRGHDQADHALRRSSGS